MSILSKKKNVFEQIAILKTANEIVVNRDLLKNQSTSLLNGKINKDPFIFLIDLLTVVSGSDSINKVVKNMVGNIGNIDATFKDKIKEEITNTIGGDKNDSTIPSFITGGYKIHLNKLDFNNDLFIQENTPEHELYLSEFQLKLQDAVKNPNTRKRVNDIIECSFNNQDGYFTFYPLNSTVKYKDFLYSFIDNVNLVNTSTIVGNSFSDLFNGKNLSKEKQILNQQIDIVLNNIIIETEEDDSYYKFNDGETELINEKISMNYTYYNDIGSDQIGTNISNADLLKAVKKYGGYNSRFFTDVIKKLNTSVDHKDRQSMANGFLSKFMVSLKNNIVKNFILSPQVILLYGMVNNNTNNNLLTPIADIRANKSLIKCIIKSIINSLMKSLFNMLKRDLLKIVSAIATMYIQESADKYKKIIQGLFKKI